MNAIELLKQQHQEVEQLFEQIEAAGENAVKAKAKLFEKLADSLAVHATLEEEIFYPASKAGATEAFLKEAVVEHLGVKRLITDLLETPVEDDNWDAMIMVLNEQVLHHKQEEEDEFFPEAERLLGDEKLEQLGTVMEARAKELLAAGDPRKSVPTQIDAPAQI